jgi:hypothetical protein
VAGVAPTPLCGNGVCEAGEVPLAMAGAAPGPLCPSDCELASTRCPVGPSGVACNGVGACLRDASGAGQCVCFAAFAGPACAACALGFVPNGHGSDGQALCVRVVPTEVDPKTGSFTPGAIAGVAIVLVAAVGLIVGLAVLRRRRSTQTPLAPVGPAVHVLSPLHGGAGRSNVQPEGVTSRVSPVRGPAGASGAQQETLDGVEVTLWASPRASAATSPASSRTWWWSGGWGCLGVGVGVGDGVVRSVFVCVLVRGDEGALCWSLLAEEGLRCCTVGGATFAGEPCPANR